jgi:hypothetical protein
MPNESTTVAFTPFASPASMLGNKNVRRGSEYARADTLITLVNRRRRQSAFDHYICGHRRRRPRYIFAIQ